MMTNTTLPFDYEFHPTAAFGDAIAASFIAAWLLGLAAFAHSVAKTAVVPIVQQQQQQQQPKAEAEAEAWKLIGALDKDMFPLYERTYASGKKAWRYRLNDKSNWIYPSRSSIDFSGITG